MFTLHAGVVSPALVGVVPSIEMVIWAAIGGRTYLMGGIVGTLLVNFAKDKISTALPELWLYALGLLFIIAVTALPRGIVGEFDGEPRFRPRSEEHTSELQSLMRISSAVFCLKKKTHVHSINSKHYNMI